MTRRLVITNSRPSNRKGYTLRYNLKGESTPVVGRNWNALIDIAIKIIIWAVFVVVTVGAVCLVFGG